MNNYFKISIFSVTCQKVAGESKLLIILSLWLLREVCCMLHVLANHFQVPSQKISIPIRYCKILMIIIIVILHLKFVFLLFCNIALFHIALYEFIINFDTFFWQTKPKL